MTQHHRIGRLAGFAVCLALPVGAHAQATFDSEVVERIVTYARRENPFEQDEAWSAWLGLTAKIREDNEHKRMLGGNTFETLPMATLSTALNDTRTCTVESGVRFGVPYGYFRGNGTLSVTERHLTTLAPAVPTIQERRIWGGGGWVFGGGATLDETFQVVWEAADPGDLQNWCDIGGCGVIGSTPPTTRCGYGTRFNYRSLNRSITFVPAAIETFGPGCTETVFVCGVLLPDKEQTCQPTATKYIATDGSATLDVTDRNNPVVHFADGSRERLANDNTLSLCAWKTLGGIHFGGPEKVVRCSATKEVIDRNGNRSTYGYDEGLLKTITDSFGRVTEFEYEPFVPFVFFRDITGVVVDGIGGIRQRYQINWRTIQPSAGVFSDVQCLEMPDPRTNPVTGIPIPGIPIPCVPNGTPGAGGINTKVVDSLVLPDGRSYRFHYDDESRPGSPTLWGTLTKVDLPDGSQTRFEYGDAGTLANKPPGHAEACITMGGFHNVNSRRPTRRIDDPDGAGPTPGSVTSYFDEPRRRLFGNSSDQPVPGRCSTVLASREVRPDGSFVRTTVCDEGGETLATHRKLVTMGRHITGEVMAVEEFDQTGALREGRYYGNAGTLPGLPGLLGEMYLSFNFSFQHSILFPHFQAHIKGTALDIRPTKVIHFREGIRWTEEMTYGDTLAIPALGGFRNTGNVTQHRLFDGAGNLVKTVNKTFLNTPAYRQTRYFTGLETASEVLGPTGILARVVRQYDQSTPRASGAANLDLSIGNVRGNLTTTTMYAKPATQEGPVSTTATYYDTGAVDVSRDGRGAPTTFVHDFAACSPTHKISTSGVVNPLQHPTTTVSDCWTGAVLRVTDPNGLSVCTQYDKFSRVMAIAGVGDALLDDTTLIKDPLCVGGAGGPTSWVELPAASAPQRWTVTHTKDGTSDGHQKRVFKDGLGRELQGCTEVDPAIHGHAWACDRTTYDVMGRISEASVPFYADGVGTSPVAAPAGTQLTRSQYDSFGRVTSTELVGPEGQSFHRTETSYGTFTFTPLNGNVTTDGFLTVVTDPNGNDTRTVSNLLGHVVETHRAWSGCPGGFCVTRMHPDVLKRVTMIKDPLGNLTTFEFDGLGNTLKSTDPDMGVWSFEYDGNGNKTRVIDAKGQVTSMTYDLYANAKGEPSNRLTLQDLPPAGPDTKDIVNTYDGTTLSTCYSCDDRCATTTDTCHAATLTCTHTGTPCDPPAVSCGPCQRLNAAGDACEPLPAGTEANCGTCEDCDGKGSCGPSAPGQQDNGCTTGATACSAADTCNGAGACVPNHLDPGTEGGCAPCQDCDGSGECKPVGLGQNDVGCDGGQTACSNPDSCDGNGVCRFNHLDNNVEGGCPTCQDCDGGGSCKFVTPGLPDNGCDAGPGLCTAADVCAASGVCNRGDEPILQCWPDMDGDGFGAAGGGVTACSSCPPNHVTNNADCMDTKANVRPGQTQCFFAHRGDGSFDYNCNGVADICSSPGGTYVASCGGRLCTVTSCQSTRLPITSSHCGTNVASSCRATSCVSDDVCQIRDFQQVGCQ